MRRWLILAFAALAACGADGAPEPPEPRPAERADPIAVTGEAGFGGGA